MGLALEDKICANVMHEITPDKAKGVQAIQCSWDSQPPLPIVPVANPESGKSVHEQKLEITMVKYKESIIVHGCVAF